MSDDISRDLFERATYDGAIEQRERCEGRSLSRDALRRLTASRSARVCLALLSIIICLSVFAPLLSHFDIREQHLTHTNAPVMTPCDDESGAGSLHIFGTDALGRDLFTRCWAGGRVSLFIAFAAALTDLLIGAIYGSVSGCFGGRTDIVMMRAIEVISGIPYLIIVILLMMVLPKGMVSIIAAYSLVGWIPMARLVRGQTLYLKQLDFIAAAEVMGASRARIIFRHILPNCASLMIVRVTLTIPSAIFTEAWLSYLGLGVQLPQCSWGTLAQYGIENFRMYPFQLIVPSLCICTTMLAFNILGDRIRDAFDPMSAR